MLHLIWYLQYGMVPVSNEYTAISVLIIMLLLKLTLIYILLIYDILRWLISFYFIIHYDTDTEYEHTGY